MFGGFSMRYGDETVIMNKQESSKSVRLLQMLLLSMPDGVPKREVIDNLYGWNDGMDGANRNKNLNNLIYRLRGQLTAGGLPEKDYVEIQGGMCCFKSVIPLQMDILEFEKTVEEAKVSSGKTRKMLLWRANEVYCGELLPANSSDMWFFQKSRYYKELYIWSVEELEKELLKSRDYKSRLLLYSRAASIYPFEGWQLKQMRCNLELYRYDEAMNIYRETMELYAQEMSGAGPAEEMRECFETLKLMDDNHCREDEDGWRNVDRAFMAKRVNLRQTLFEEKNVKGAYYCTYPSFVDYCHLVVRAKERSRFSAILMFLTLTCKKAKVSMDLSEQMLLLKRVLGESLRVGDAYTRYGNRHFILVLVKTEMEFCSTVFRRVETTYKKEGGKGDLWYYADMTQELDRAAL